MPSSDCSGSLVTLGKSAGVTAVNGDFMAVAARSSVAPPGTRSALVELFLRAESSATPVTYFDEVILAPSGGCMPDPYNACLDGGRFQVTALGEYGRSNVVQMTSDTAYLWFFTPNNVDIVAKVLNACSIGPSHWVFLFGGTDITVTVEVTDTKTGDKKTYTNLHGVAFRPVQDTSAFACP